MKILVVDDEPLIRGTVAEIFRDAGADVVESADAKAAMRALASEPDIALLFTDIRMPGMSGVELAQHASRLRPDLRIVLTTGFTDVNLQGYEVLRKPWDISQLQALVSRAA